MINKKRILCSSKTEFEINYMWMELKDLISRCKSEGEWQIPDQFAHQCNTGRQNRKQGNKQ